MTGLATSSLDVGRADAGSFAGGVGKLSWYSFRLITGLQDLGGVAASQMAESDQAGPRQCFLGFPLLLLWEVAERCEKECARPSRGATRGSWWMNFRIPIRCRPRS